ncbi:MAG: DUF1553 domain-containing protein, partial [Pirellulales bacterium]
MRILQNVLLFISFAVPSAALAEKTNQVDFTRDIKPILSDRCYTCHGPDAQSREADLRLDLRDEAFAALSSSGGKIIVAGKPHRSELFLRVTETDTELKMPPPDSKLSLNPAEIELIKQWISQGAKWNHHWSFGKVVKPAPPRVGKSTWIRNDIDRFVLQRLRQVKQSPAKQATAETLIRRVAFDLTGLPPPVEMLDRYLASPNEATYAAIVDELLKSDHYGERMASAWMDVARYSDTYGYQVDRDRQVWRWRDWVINAYNNNLSYDRFITQQIAGDLLPEATDDQRLATTFNRLHSQKVEGGSTPEEFRVEYVADRTHTFATAFLGLTLECCRCHDHKYDPFSQVEYYQLYAYFNNIDEAGLYSYFTASVPTPTLAITSADQKTQLVDLAAQVQAAQEKLAVIRESATAAFDLWLQNRPKFEDAGELSTALGEVEHLQFEDTKLGANKSVPGKVGQAIQLTGDDAVNLSVGNFTRSTPFSISLWMKTPDRKKRAVVFHRSRAFTDSASRGYQLLIEEGELSASLIHFWPGNAIRVRTTEELPIEKWVHVTMVYDGSSRAAGLRLFVDGELAETYVVRDHLVKNITGSGGANIAIGERFRDLGFSGGTVDEFRVFQRAITPLEIKMLFSNELQPIALKISSGDLDKTTRAELFDMFLSLYHEPWSEQQAVLKQAREVYNNLNNSLQEIMVMQEMQQRRPTFVLNRGVYDDPLDAVMPNTPVVFPSSTPTDNKVSSTANRLTLARWLTDPSHPLTSRVAVNRIWQLLLGQGLVRTPEDFGSQGESPTHPQLLNWLAATFMESNWDTKLLIRKIVLSATYRQSSLVGPEIAVLDPENRLLTHANRFQFPAEMLRDNVLSVSGLLVDKTGGPSVKPYEVAESFKAVSRGKGDSLYRRSLYTYWKRTGPAPVMMTLDASKREVCNVKRERTASPLHAMVLLNDPQLIEAARVVGQAMIKKHGADHVASISELFRRFTSRFPSERESAVLCKAYQQQFDYFSKRPEQAT